VTQANSAVGIHRTTSDEQIKPELALVCFLFNDPHLGDEFTPGTGSTSRPVIRADRRTGAEQLLADNIGCTSRRKILDERHHGQRELLGTLNELSSGHDLTLSIRNPQSEIRN